METTMDTRSETREPVDLSALLAKQRMSFLRDGPPALAQRRANLKRLKTALLARREALARAVDSDFGHRSAYETAIVDFVPLIHGINYLHRRLGKWMRPRRRHIALHFQPGAAR